MIYNKADADWIVHFTSEGTSHYYDDSTYANMQITDTVSEQAGIAGVCGDYDMETGPKMYLISA